MTMPFCSNPLCTFNKMETDPKTSRLYYREDDKDYEIYHHKYISIRNDDVLYFCDVCNEALKMTRQ